MSRLAFIPSIKVWEMKRDFNSVTLTSVTFSFRFDFVLQFLRTEEKFHECKLFFFKYLEITVENVHFELIVCE